MVSVFQMIVIACFLFVFSSSLYFIVPNRLSFVPFVCRLRLRSGFFVSFRCISSFHSFSKCVFSAPVRRCVVFFCVIIKYRRIVADASGFVPYDLIVSSYH
eukprot:736634_1